MDIRRTDETLNFCLKTKMPALMLAFSIKAKLEIITR